MVSVTLATIAILAHSVHTLYLAYERASNSPQMVEMVQLKLHQTAESGGGSGGLGTQLLSMSARSMSAERQWWNVSRLEELGKGPLPSHCAYVTMLPGEGGVGYEAGALAAMRSLQGFGTRASFVVLMLNTSGGAARMERLRRHGVLVRIVAPELAAPELAGLIALPPYQVSLYFILACEAREFVPEGHSSVCVYRIPTYNHVRVSHRSA